MMSTARPDLVGEHAAAVPASDEWETVVWDDPVNLMSYVVHVFRTYFGYPRPQATRLMLQVHENGSAVVAVGPREQMELHAHAMHDYGLWATIRRSDDGR